MWIRTCASCICQSSTGEPKYQPSNRSEAPPWVIFVNSLAVSAWRERCFQGSIQQQHPGHTPGKPTFYRPFWKGSRSHPAKTFPDPKQGGLLQQRDPSPPASLAGKSMSAPRVTSHKFATDFLAVVIQVHWSPQLKHPGKPSSKCKSPKLTTTYASPENVHESLGSLEMSPELGSFHAFFKVP